MGAVCILRRNVVCFAQNTITQEIFMKTAVRSQTVLLIVLVLVIGIALGLLIARPLFNLGGADNNSDADEHEGQVYIYDGFDWVWMTPLEGVPVNDFSKEEFVLVNGMPVYQGNGFKTLLGVDVSEHQGEIDWTQVSGAGIKFAYIQIGHRGYTEGGLFSDPWFENNFSGAKDNNIQIGVYFFSQAVSVAEAEEEARFVLDKLQGRELDLPVVFDWEKIDNSDGDTPRTRDVDLKTRTDCAVAFCRVIEEAGYQASVYFNRNLGYYGYDLRRLVDYDFWFALFLNPPEELYWPSFYYKVNLWQFSESSTVPGISGPADLDMMFIPDPDTPEAAVPTA